MSNRRGDRPYILWHEIKSYVTKWAGFTIWQKSFNDRIIRNEKEYYKIVEYIENNPSKWIEKNYCS